MVTTQYKTMGLCLDTGETNTVSVLSSLKIKFLYSHHRKCWKLNKNSIRNDVLKNPFSDEIREKLVQIFSGGLSIEWLFCSERFWITLLFTIYYILIIFREPSAFQPFNKYKWLSHFYERSFTTTTTQRRCQKAGDICHRYYTSTKCTTMSQFC